MQQSSVLLARALSQKTRSLLVEQALLSVEAKLVQPANPCFQCNLLQVPESLPEWLQIDFDFDFDKDKDNPHLRLPAPSAAPRQSKLLYPTLTAGHKANPFKLDHVIPSDELTHDTMTVGGATKCCNVQWSSKVCIQNQSLLSRTVHVR